MGKNKREDNTEQKTEAKKIGNEQNSENEQKSLQQKTTNTRGEKSKRIIIKDNEQIVEGRKSSEKQEKDHENGVRKILTEKGKAVGVETKDITNEVNSKTNKEESVEQISNASPEETTLYDCDEQNQENVNEQDKNKEEVGDISKEVEASNKADDQSKETSTFDAKVEEISNLDTGNNEDSVKGEPKNLDVEPNQTETEDTSGKDEFDLKESDLQDEIKENFLEDEDFFLEDEDFFPDEKGGRVRIHSKSDFSFDVRPHLRNTRFILCRCNYFEESDDEEDFFECECVGAVVFNNDLSGRVLGVYLNPID